MLNLFLQKWGNSVVDPVVKSQRTQERQNHAIPGRLEWYWSQGWGDWSENHIDAKTILEAQVLVFMGLREAHLPLTWPTYSLQVCFSRYLWFSFTVNWLPYLLLAIFSYITCVSIDSTSSQLQFAYELAPLYFEGSFFNIFWTTLTVNCLILSVFLNFNSGNQTAGANLPLFGKAVHAKISHSL